MTSSRQATASEERSGVFWKFQKSQMKEGSQPAGAAASPAVTRVIGMRGKSAIKPYLTNSLLNIYITEPSGWNEQATPGDLRVWNSKKKQI